MIEVNMGIKMCLTERICRAFFMPIILRGGGGGQISTGKHLGNGAGVTRTTLAKSNAKKQEIKQGGM